MASMSIGHFPDSTDRESPQPILYQNLERRERECDGDLMLQPPRPVTTPLIKPQTFYSLQHAGSS
ncbi:hypothetical protein FOTG_18618 [Fusarium oxysporum f. sp. vasinfectum 25433]|uniref:Uncharacterized protein n=1 Tax=Fusarium oxysporum f. sp. vasinfectum 25433 TaxID=1089449 RepID=X0LWR1_FUSOX|nr:hypothetical protein FOTG_18618 [Fusarium oxysporum f. sp. vasinfectum 25433]